MLLNFKNFRFLTDENIQPEILTFLRENGATVLDVKELNFFGKSDSFLFDFANKENLVIITHDSDFGKIVFLSDTDFTGIIYLRPGHFNPEISKSSIKALFNKNIDLYNRFIITAENNLKNIKIRIRQI